MANFTPKKLNQDTINGGNQFQEDSFFTPKDANSMVEGILNAQKEIDEIKANPPSSGGSEIIVDDQLSETSTNPVQNKVIKVALEGKLDKLPLDMTSSDTIVYTNDGKRVHKLGSNENKSSVYNIPMYFGGNAGKNNVNGHLLTAPPKNPYHCANMKYVDDLIAEHLDEFHKQWYENIAIADIYSAGYVSSTKLPNPTKIRIEKLELGKEYSEEVGDFANYYGLATPQTFDITPDSNGNFSVIINANVYKKWEYNEEYDEWMPPEDNTPIQENVPLTLNFKFSFEDVVGDGVNQSLIFCYNLNTELNDYCEVSLYC